VKIGIFDSGLGGLCVLYEAWRNLDAEFIYFADSCNAPYGEKSRTQILELSENIVKFLIQKKASAIAIACNTASSVFTHEIRAKYPLPIIAMEPAVKKASELYSGAKILVCATEITINGEKLKNLLADLRVNADLLALGGLVRLAENGEFNASSYLGKFEKNIKNADVLVLGCTHFNYFKSEFLKINPNLKFVDGNLGTVKQILRKLEIPVETMQERKFEIEKLMSENEFFISKSAASASELDLMRRCLLKLDEEYQI